MRRSHDARALAARAASATRAALTLLVAAGAVGTAGAAGAQLPNASATATGLSGAFSARARGYDAVAWNPANLGMPDNPGFSLGLLAFHGASGLDPISLNDLAPYSGKDLPKSQREAWLQTVTTNGGEHGTFDAGLTLLGLSAGHIGFQVATAVSGASTLSPDAVEAMLFGNAGRTGEVKSFNLKGSDARVGAFTTGAVSYGASSGTDMKTGTRSSWGITAKYTIGNFLAMSQDDGSTTTADAVSVKFPTIWSNPDSSTTVGSGFGFDLGYATTQGKTTYSATVENVFNTFKWDTAKLLSKPGVALFDANGSTTDFEDQPYANAPETLKSRVANDKFKPTITAGVAYAWSPAVTLSADTRVQTGEGIRIGPKTIVSTGVEYRGIPVLRLRGGLAYVTDGWGYSGGVGINLGRYELGVGAGLRTVNSGKEPIITLNLLSIH